MQSKLLTSACSLLLSLACWLGVSSTALALPLGSPFTVPTVLSTQETAMAKPLFSFAGKRPSDLGVQNGKLAACPGSPNCVNSQAPDAEHSIAPLTYSSTPAEALSKLKSVIQGMERTHIISETDDYLYAEFTSKLMGFVDDVEFYLDPSSPGQIQVRSASRLGESDLGVNRKRIEAIREGMGE